MERDDIIERFLSFFNEFYLDEIVKSVAEGKKSIEIDFSFLDKFDVELADYLLENPEETISIAEESIKQIDTGLTETKLRIRFFNLPESREIRIRNVRSEHIGKMIVIDGIVKRASEIRPEVSESIFQCPECGNNISMIQTERIIRAPVECDSCKNRKGFRLISQKLYDARWIVVEEPFEIVTGEKPSELGIYLKEDLTSPRMQNKTDPGNRIKVTGVLKQMLKWMKGAKSRQMDIYLDANHVQSVEMVWEELEISEEDEKRIVELSKDPMIFQKLIGSLAPSMYEMDEVKEAIILQMFGGEPKSLKDGTKIRGTIHLLLIGDPSSGKSQLMQLSSRMMPRGRYVSGSGMTAAGITATVVKDEEFLGGWVLEAGALVMANRSICCLHPSSNIILNNRIIPISEIFDKETSEKALCNGNVIDVCSLNSFVPSFNLNSLKVKQGVSDLIRRSKFKGKMLNILLESGFNICLTPEHMLIDGNTLSWKSAKEFIEGDHILAPLKIPTKQEEMYILDLMPDDWKVCLTKKDKMELKRDILKRHRSLAEFNRKLSIPKSVLSGSCQPTIKEFKDMIKEVNVFEKWKKKTLRYGRKTGKLMIRNPEVTPELGYILGFIFGDGFIERKVSHGGIRVTQSIRNKDLSDRFIANWNLTLSEKLHNYKDYRTSKIRGKEVESKSDVFYRGSNLLVFLYDRLIGKSLENILSLPDEVLKGFIAGAMDSNGCVSIKKCEKGSKNYKTMHVEFLLSKKRDVNLNFMLALRRFDVYSRLIMTDKNVDIIRITGRKDIISLKSAIGHHSVKMKIEIPERLHSVSSSSDKLPSYIVAEIARKILEELNTSVLNKEGIRSLYDYKNLKCSPSRDELTKILKKVGGNLSQDIRNEIEKLVQRDFFLDKIVKIVPEDYDGFVYDLHIPETNNFIANGLFVHNCIDEFSKVSPPDRVALQEAMSLETISIAKASIVATLPAQTAVLAGGNPKLGRFDPYLPIREQVDIDDVLLSRFDLKFALRDIPNPDLDTRIADHVLKMRHFEEEEAKPIIPVNFLRKYIAYSRSKIHPVLTKEAGERLKEFYLEMRAKAGEEAPLSITLRQYDALIRLAEASARVRLSNTVDLEDAERSIRLMKISLRQFGFEPETGKIDIDRAEGSRLTSVQRNRVRIVLDIIDELVNVHGKDVPIEDIISRAKAEGVENPVEVLRKMQSEGILYSPKPNFVSKV